MSVGGSSRATGRSPSCGYARSSVRLRVGQATFWGPRVGLSEADCDALVIGGGEWSAQKQALIDAVDAVEDRGGLDGAGWAALQLDDEQVVEVLSAVGGTGRSARSATRLRWIRSRGCRRSPGS